MHRLEQRLGAAAALGYRRPLHRAGGGGGALRRRDRRRRPPLPERRPHRAPAALLPERAGPRRAAGALRRHGVRGGGRARAPSRRRCAASPTTWPPSSRRWRGSASSSTGGPSTSSPTGPSTTSNLPDLQEVEGRVKAREKWERRQRNPLLVKLDDEAGRRRSTSPTSRPGTPAPRAAGSSATARATTSTRQTRMVVLLAKPAGLSSDLAYAKQHRGPGGGAPRQAGPLPLRPRLPGRRHRHLQEEARPAGADLPRPGALLDGRRRADAPLPAASTSAAWSGCRWCSSRWAPA